MRVLLKSPIGPGGIFCGAAHGVVWCDKNYGIQSFFLFQSNSTTRLLFEQPLHVTLELVIVLDNQEHISFFLFS